MRYLKEMQKISLEITSNIDEMSEDDNIELDPSISSIFDYIEKIDRGLPHIRTLSNLETDMIQTMEKFKHLSQQYVKSLNMVENIEKIVLKNLQEIDIGTLINVDKIKKSQENIELVVGVVHGIIEIEKEKNGITSYNKIIRMSYFIKACLQVINRLNWFCKETTENIFKIEEGGEIEP